jgi:hypothetical protein
VASVYKLLHRSLIYFFGVVTFLKEKKQDINFSALMINVGGKNGGSICLMMGYNQFSDISLKDIPYNHF